MDGLSRRLILGSIALAVLLHVFIVASILRQPFDVQLQPPQERSVVWVLCHDSAHMRGPFTDFFAIYNAGLSARAGQGFYGRACSPQVPYAALFRYLPVVTYTLGYGLSLFSPRTAGILWVLLLEALLAAFLWLFCVSVRHPWVRLLAVVVLLLSIPYFLELHVGQFTFGTLTLTAMALLLLENAARARREDPAGPSGLSRGEFLAAACFTVAVLTKVFPLVIAPALLRRGKAGWVCVFAACGALILCNWPYFLTHPGSWKQYLDSNFSLATVWQGLMPGNFGLLYMIHIGLRDLGLRWSDAGWAAFTQIWRILILAPVALLVLFSRRADLRLGAAALVLAHFATFHHVWEHHWSGAIPLGLLLLWRAAETEAGQEAGSNRGGTSGMAPRGLLGISLVLLLWAMPSPSVVFDRLYCPPRLNPLDTWPEWAKLVTPAFKVVPMIVLLAWTLRDLCQAGFRWPWPRRRERDGAGPSLALLLLLAAPTLLMPAQAQAVGGSGFVDLELGKSVPSPSDLTLDQPARQTDLRIHDLSFRDDSFVDPPWYCLRLGRWEARPDWLGFAIEFLHPKLFARVEEERRISGVHGGMPVDQVLPVDSLVQSFNLSHGESRLSFEVLFRRGLLKRQATSAPKGPIPSSGIPAGLRPAAHPADLPDLLQIFGGIGAGPVIAHPESRIDGEQGKARYQVAGPGYEGFAGFRIFPWRSLGLVLEYKYTAADLKVDVAQGSARLKERTSHFSSGLTYQP
jgi:hypothetical protein